MTQRFFAAALAAAMFSMPIAARAENRPADACQIFITKVGTSPSSHGSASITAIVKVGWIGNGEFIERVGFWSQRSANDLGNGAGHCGTWSGVTDAERQWHVQDPAPYAYPPTAYGEYVFRFPTYSGSVTSACPGYTYDNFGAFFVQTNKNTYWLNPDLDAGKLYHFDANGYQILARQLGLSVQAGTTLDFLRYYNPLVCR